MRSSSKASVHHNNIYNKKGRFFFVASRKNRGSLGDIIIEETIVCYLVLCLVGNIVIHGMLGVGGTTHSRACSHTVIIVMRTRACSITIGTGLLPYGTVPCKQSVAPYVRYRYGHRHLVYR